MSRTLIVLVVVAGLLAAVQPVAAEVDTTPPETTIIGGPAEGQTLNSDDPMFAWESSEANSTFACSTDGVALETCEMAFITGAAPGPHNFTVAATDASGNTDPTPATRNFRVSLKAFPPELARCQVDGNVLIASIGDDRLVGTSRSDLIYGLSGDDVLRGGSGDDCIAGGAGDDRINAGRGKDLVVGGSGDDTIHGSADNDELYGSAGKDRIIGGSGNDVLEGEAGGDRLTDHTGRDKFSGGSGNDRIDARDTSRYGRTQADTVRCGSGRYDIAYVDRRDRVNRDCERVRRRR